MSKLAAIITVIIVALAAGSCLASSRLLYLEAQAVGGYNFAEYNRRVHWYSMDQMDVMQKPSLGFDCIQRFSGAGGDWGMLAVQARLAYDPTVKHDVEPQLYNAYLKVKPGFGDIWLGHNKPAFGLASYLDNHGTLLQPLSMAGLEGYSFDRDWGIGYYRDLDWGNLSASATLGSGMPLIMRGNRLFSARVAKGDLNRDNYTVGLSASYGKIPFWIMGYHTVYDHPPIENYMLGSDATIFWNRFESRTEIIGQRYFLLTVGAVGWHALERLSLNVMNENKLRLEFQFISGMRKEYKQLNSDSYVRYYKFRMDNSTIGISYIIMNDLTFRLTMNVNNYNSNAAAQLYWYHKL
jgi:hypothetical protein